MGDVLYQDRTSGNTFITQPTISTAGPTYLVTEGYTTLVVFAQPFLLELVFEA